ncbi:MAG TPA: hypothetical protein VIL09_08600 [Microvirga sp.]
MLEGSQPRTARVWGLAAALYILAWAVLASPWLSGIVTIPWDAKAHFYPQLQFLAQSLHRGESPFWAPYVFSGQPQIADPQSLIFSPPFLLLAALDPDPGFQAFDGVVLGMLGLGGLFLMAWFRDRGWHPAGAIVAALVFAFGASAAWRVQHVGQVLSLAYWPIALWLLSRALSRRSVPYGLAAGLVAGLLALGRDQVAYLSLLVLAGMAVALIVQERIRVRSALPPLLSGAAGGLAVVLVPVALTLLFAGESNRPSIAYGEAARGAIHPALLLTGVIPNLFGVDGPFMDYWGPPSPRWGESSYVLARNMGVLYMGALPFALLLAGLCKGVLWAREIRPVAIAFALMLAYALGSATPVFRIAFEALPGIAFFRRPADSLFLVGALGAILSGYLVHRIWSGSFLREGHPWGMAEIVIAMGAFAAAIGLAVARGTVPIATWPIAKAALCLAVAVAALAVLPTLRLRRPRAALALLVALVAADLAWNNGPNESTALPPDTYEVLRPDSRNPLLAAIKERLGPDSLARVELAGLGFHWPNASLVHRLHHVLGYNPVRIGDYAAATGAEDHVALPDQRRFSPLFPSYAAPLADLLGLRLVATGVPAGRIDPALRPGDLVPLAQTADGHLYENPGVLPRASFASRALAVDPAALIKDGRWPAVDLGTTVLLDRVPPDPAVTILPSTEPAQVTIAHYANTAVAVDVRAPAPGYLVLNDPYHPWWVAELDGYEVPLLRANGIMRAVSIPTGTHRVRFVFRPFRGAWLEAGRRWPVIGRVQDRLREITR